MKLYKKYILFILLFIVILIPIEITYNYSRIMTNDNKIVKVAKKLLNHNVELRKFPYPYKSMLALCSDIDGTTLPEFLDYHRFLNTNVQTEYGKGLGLDVGDTFWMYVGNDDKSDFDYKNAKVKDEMSYWYGLDNKRPHDKDEILKFLKVGWIDCMHSYGDFTMQKKNEVSFNKKFAAPAINELRKQGVYVKVWLDHGSPSNVQNFVSSNIYRFQKGDNQYSKYYHTNLLIPYGIKFGWGPTSSEFGYNSMIFPRRLKDGNKLWVFSRYSENSRGNLIWDPEFIDKEFSKQNLESLIDNHQYTIVAEHLGIRHNKFLFNQNALTSLRYLDQQYVNHNILVARTSRLLNYNLVQQYLDYKATIKNNRTYINIVSVNDPWMGKYIPTLNDLRGVTFYVDNPHLSEILLDGKPVNLSYISDNHSDYTGRKSISIKWFNEDINDYTKIQNNRL
ncbi:MAG: hypothetical protein Q8934_07445 [Bacillota bacterium]|nr:hypothetical protein [Bacillota bacterium]